MNSPLVSIIIPVYNGEQFLAAAIENALQQSWPNKQIIIVDDGSSDKSLLIAKGYEGEYVTVVTTTNGGAARARNIGFGHATGDYIQYMDADDLMVENKIELQMSRFLQDPHPTSIICAGQWLRFNTTLQDTIGGIGPGGPAENDMDSLDWLLLRPFNLMTIHAWLTPRLLIEKAGPWNESMTLDDDGEFFIRVVAMAQRVIFCSGAITYYRTLPDKITLSNYANFGTAPDNCEKLKSAYKSLETFRRILTPVRKPDVRRTLARNFLYMAFDSYLACNEVYRHCIKQPEIPFFQRFIIFQWMRGKFGLLTLLLGWRTTKRMLVAMRKN